MGNASKLHAMLWAALGVCLLCPAPEISTARNRLKNGSFEGSTKYWLEGGTVVSENAAHGEHALRIEGKVRSASFTLEPGETVTISLYARTHGAGEVRVVPCPSNRGVAQGTNSVWRPDPRFERTAEIGPQWRRVAWTLEVPELGEGGKFLGSKSGWWNNTSWIMWISGTKPLYVDAVSVVPGKNPVSYVPRSPVEVTSTVTNLPGYRENGNILEAGSTVQVRGTAFNPGETSRQVTLRWELLDYRGEKKCGQEVIREVRLDPGETVVETVPMRLAGRGLMLARVSAVDADGEVIEGSDQPVTVLAFPKSAGSPNPAERFGGSLRGGVLVECAQRIGLGWSRWYPDLNWADVQSEGPEDWQLPDREMGDLHSRGISVIGVLYSLPDWAKGDHGHLPKDMQDWGQDDPRWKDLSVQTSWDRFVTRTVKHYADHSVAWEFCNEPDIGEWNHGVYFNMARRTYRLIKKADPDARVLVNVTWPGVSGWTMDFLRRGGGKYFDVHTFHNYSQGPLARPDSIRQLKTAFKSFGQPGKGIWFDEGWTYVPTSVDYPAPPIVDKRAPEVADMIVRTAADLFAAGMDKLITFHIGYADHGKSWWDWVGSGTEWWDDKEYPTVAVPVYNVLSDQLGLSSHVETIRPPGAVLHVFQDERHGRGVIVAWSEGEAQELMLPLEDLTRLDVMGNVAEIPGDGGKSVLSLPADSRPFYVFSRKGLSGEELAGPLKSLEREAAETAGGKTYTPPESWTGSEMGNSTGSVIEKDGRTLWRLGRLWPPDPAELGNYKDLLWSGKNWHATEHELGGQPAVTVTPSGVQLGARSAWGGGHKAMLPYLMFVAPEPGNYTLKSPIENRVWYGSGPVYLRLFKVEREGVAEELAKVELQSRQDAKLDSARIELDRGDRLALVPGFPRMNVAANIRLTDLRIIRLDQETGP